MRKQKPADKTAPTAISTQGLHGRIIGLLAGLTALTIAAAWAVWQNGLIGQPLTAPPDAAGDVISDEWFASYLNGAKIGHARKTVRGIHEDGRPLRKIDELHVLSAAKGGDRVESTITTSEIVTPGGQLVSFRHEVRQSRQPLVTSGRVNGSFLDIEQTTLGQTTTRRLPWSAQTHGSDGLDRNLVEPPIRPGESRAFQSLAPTDLGVAENSLRAAAYEPTALLDTRRDLLRIEWIAKYPRGMTVRSTVWVDQQGRWQKQRNEDLGLEIYRVTQREALAPGSGGPLNLLFDTLIKVARPIPNPAPATIRYRIQLEQADPAELFAASPIQTVKSLDGHSAEVTVRSANSIRQNTPNNIKNPPTDDDRNPGVMIQSHHPPIVALANEVQRDTADHEKLARALARLVNSKMKRVDFTQAFATAAEVADDLRGDCSEHAVLLAALLRARNIPARVAMGWVYVEPAQAFGYHMWTEAWIDDRWFPLDGTTGAATGATYLTVATTSLAAGLGDPSFLRIARLLGAKPKIEVLAVE